MNHLYCLQEINKDSLSTILSVSKYTNKAYKAAMNLIDNYESKYGVLKSIPQKVIYSFLWLSFQSFLESYMSVSDG